MRSVLDIAFRRPPPFRRFAARFRAVWMILGGAAALTFARALLPLVLTRLANRALRKTPPYKGTIDDARIDLWNGRFVLFGVALTTPGERTPVPAAKIDRVTIQLDWKKLFRGVLVASADIERPVVLVRADAGEEKRISKAVPEERPQDVAASGGGGAPAVRRPLQPVDPDQRWNRKVAKLFPIRIDHVALSDGELHVLGLKGQNGTDVTLDGLNVRVENVVNSSKAAGTLEARLHADARVMRSGQLRVDGRVFPFEDDPTFELDLALDRLDLTHLSDLARNNASTEVRQGELSLFAEAAAAGGRLKGYAKPLIEHLEVSKDGGDGAATGVVLRNVVRLLRNGKTDRIATRVDFEGDLTDPSVGVAKAVKTTLVNAFSQPLKGDFDSRADVSMASTAFDAEAARAEAGKKPSRLKVFFGVLKEAASRWSGDQAPRMGATLSYYTAFSMAPLLLLAISIAGLVFGRDAVQGRVVGQLGGLVGQQGAAAIQSMLQAASSKSSAATASVIGILSLLVGASAVMTELKLALNTIWRVKGKSGLKAAIVDKLLSFGMVTVLGFLLLVSLLASAALSALGKYLGGVLPVPSFVLQTLNVVVSFAVFVAMFAAMFKALPDAKIRWRDVLIGGVATSLLFVAGKFALGAYLGKSAVGSSYGTAGSVLVIMLWIYYSAQILYFGAEFTKVYADRLGGGIRPSDAGLPEKLAY